MSKKNKNIVYMYRGPTREIPWREIMLAIEARRGRDTVVALTMTCDVADKPSLFQNTDQTSSLGGEHCAVAPEAVSEKTGKRPTLADVAREAKVSTSTASRVVNNQLSVNPILRTRVEDAMTRLGYMPNEAARAMRSMAHNRLSGGEERGDRRNVIAIGDARPAVPDFKKDKISRDSRHEQ